MPVFTVQKETRVSIEIKKSQFIAHIVPYAEFDLCMQRLREEHPKGRHFVYAVRYMNEHGQIVENCSDDGEPKNTSGRPTLKVLQGHDIVDAGVITVRYFGGVKLGTGGLVRAYNDAAQEAVSGAELIDLDSLSRRSFTVAYDQIRLLEYHIDRLGLEVVEKEFLADSAAFLVQGESEKLQELADNTAE